MTHTADQPEWTQRHPSIAHFEPLFAVAHLPVPLQNISILFQDMAHQLVSVLDDGPELSAGLRKLLEAKDCCVRQGVLSLQNDSNSNALGNQL